MDDPLAWPGCHQKGRFVKGAAPPQITDVTADNLVLLFGQVWPGATANPIDTAEKLKMSSIIPALGIEKLLVMVGELLLRKFTAITSRYA